FFFQAEDGIRDGHVTGVQTCALPISRPLEVRLSRHPKSRDLRGGRPLRWRCPGQRAAHIRHGIVITAPDYAFRFQRRNAEQRSRSEERRVGKECRSRWSAYE